MELTSWGDLVFMIPLEHSVINNLFTVGKKQQLQKLLDSVILTEFNKIQVIRKMQWSKFCECGTKEPI